MTRYVAFLRGINVGGNRVLKMDDIRKAFESLGFKDVKTVLASGNVIFDAPRGTPPVLSGKIETKLLKTFKHTIAALVRSIDDLQRLADAKPFKSVKVTPETRRYVTFLNDRPRPKKTPQSKASNEGFKILRRSDSEVCTVLTLSPNFNTIDLMTGLEKEYGSNVTTRSWNTIERILTLTANR